MRRRLPLASSGSTLSLLTVGLLVAGLLATTGCTSSRYARARSDFDAEVDFSRYVAYAWLEPELRAAPAEGRTFEGHPFESNTLIDKRIRRAVDKQLAERGYQRAAGERPDFLVRYKLSFEEDEEEDDDPYYRHRRRRTERYEEAVLFVDVIDARTQRLAWRGWAHSRNRDGFFTDAHLRKSVGNVLREFPPEGREPLSDEEQLRRRVRQLEEELRAQQEAERQAQQPPAPAASSRRGGATTGASDNSQVRPYSNEWRD